MGGTSVPVRGGRRKKTREELGLAPDVFFCAGCAQPCNYPKRCSRCKQVAYCTPECQRKAWPLHKRKCVPPRPTKTLCPYCGLVEESDQTGPVVAVGATRRDCRECGQRGSGDPAIDARLLEELVKRRPKGPHVSLACAVVGKNAADALRKFRDDGLEPPEAVKQRALDYLSRSAHLGVAASAAALGQVYYWEAVNRQKLDERGREHTPTAPGAAPGAAPDFLASGAVIDLLSMARNWYQTALDEKGQYRFSEDERNNVLALPYVRSLLLTDTSCAETTPIPAESPEGKPFPPPCAIQPAFGRSFFLDEPSAATHDGLRSQDSDRRPGGVGGPWRVAVRPAVSGRQCGA